MPDIPMSEHDASYETIEHVEADSTLTDGTDDNSSGFYLQAALPSVRLARAAVLIPIGDVLKHSTHPIACANATLQWWKTVVQSLRELGVGRFESTTSCKWAKRCWPSMIAFNRPMAKIHHCGNYLCPWCWGRMVEQLGRIFLLDDEDAFRAQPDNHRIILVERDIELDLLADIATIKAAMIKQARCCRVFTSAQSDCLMGTFWHVYADPYDGQLVIRARLLGKADTSGEDIELAPIGGKLSDNAASNQDAVRYAIKELGLYPRGIVAADIGLLARIVQAKDSLRLHEATGSFRRKRTRKTR